MITNLCRTIKAKIRASSIKEIALNRYEDILNSCMKVTAANPSLCFILHKKGIYGAKYCYCFFNPDKGIWVAEIKECPKDRKEE